MSTQEYRWTSGWVTFAAIVMFAVGFFRVLSGFSYLADSHKVNDFSSGFFGDNLWAWGLWDLAIAALALYAGYSLISNGQFGRVVAYIWGVVVIVNSFLIMRIAPWYAAVGIALAALVIYGLASTPDEPRRT
jgi:hypothetical protein